MKDPIKKRGFEVVFMPEQLPTTARGRDGEPILLLLGGGTKRGQNRDIRNAKDRWKDDKDRL